MSAQTERQRLRSARKRLVRPKTLQLVRYGRSERKVNAANEPDEGRRRLPLVRGECAETERPCPFISCRYHLFLDVNDRGGIKLNFPDLFDADGTPALEGLRETCTLDVADREDATLEHVGELLNVTRERARQLENEALARLSVALKDYGE